MRATVVESRNGKSVILTEDGMFRDVKGDYQVGWEFDFREPRIRNRKITGRIAAAAACLMMVATMGTYSYQNYAVYATVTLRGTAPIQIELNRKDKVIGVKAIDESGEELAAELLDSGVRGESLVTAVARAEELLQAHKGDKNTAVNPQIQCKSSDKAKALKDILNKDVEGKIINQEAASSSEASDKDSGKATEASSASSAEIISQEEETSPTEASSSEGNTDEDITAQEETSETGIVAQEAQPADADASAAAADEADSGSASGAPAADGSGSEGPTADGSAEE